MTFEEYVDLLRRRTFDADAINPSEIHSVKELMSDVEAPDNWYADAFEELEAQGHLSGASSFVSGDAPVRLSPDGKLHVRESARNE